MQASEPLVPSSRAQKQIFGSSKISQSRSCDGMLKLKSTDQELTLRMRRQKSAEHDRLASHNPCLSIWKVAFAL